MHWLIDLGVSMVMATFFFDLLSSDPLVAWGIALVGVFYLMTMFNEVVEHFTGSSAW